MDSPARYIDHTLLRADCTIDEIATLCEDAVEYGFAAVCIPPTHVPVAKEFLYGSEVATCTVIGFPLGYQATATKVFETANAIDSGADEIDMVINLGAARGQNFSFIEEEIRRVVEASADALLKVIIECCLFDDAVKSEIAGIAVKAGADYVKTSTGFAAAGATCEDVRLLASAVSGQAGVKAAGGIRDWQTMQKMLASGATRIGTSAGVCILRQWQEREGPGCL